MDYIDLLNKPEKYKPLGSRKALNNKEYKHQFASINIKGVFMSDSNLRLLAHSLYSVHRRNGGRSKLDRFNKITPLLAVEFCKGKNLNGYTDVASSATGQVDWVEVLKAVNNSFMKFCYSRFQWNHFVPTREWAEVGSSGVRKQKRFHQIRPEDVGTLDYWQHQETYRDDSIYRYGNEIPFWQTTMHKRHYDRSNEGFRYDHTDRASLSTPVYNTYDMSQIHKTLDKWKDTEWFGM